MPKVRQHKQPPAQALLVSPWQTKKGGGDAQHDAVGAAAPDTGRWYSVVTSSDLMAPTPAPAASVAAGVAMQHASPPLQQQRHQPRQPQHATSDDGSGWHQRRPQPAAPQQQQHQQPLAAWQQQQPQQAAGLDAAASDTTTEGSDGGVGAAADADQAAAGPTTSTLQGAAQLVLLPDGSITGQFVATSPSSSTNSATSRGLCLGLRGTQVLGLHSCYRDPEWALLQLAVIRYDGSSGSGSQAAACASERASSDAALLQAAAAAGGAAGADVAAALQAAVESAAASAATADSGDAEGQAEAVAWVQRTGGDLATLSPADFDDEDTEAVVRAENLGTLPPNVLVDFTPHTLLACAAAEAALAKWPALLPASVPASDAIVNIGSMNIAELPAGFLTL